jgi:hypothetical protein
MEAGIAAISEAVWRQIEPARPSGDELVARQAAPDVSPRLLAAIDFRGRRHFLVTLNDEDDGYQDVGSRGISVRTEELVLKDALGARFLKIVCDDPAGHAMFDLIGAEIAERLHSATDMPADIVSRVLAKWRRFWGQAPNQILSREGQIGLFSELWFLTYWLVPTLGSAEGSRMWRGPHGARHDFERQGLSVEAKGTTSTRGRVHKVHGIRQLDPPEAGILYFFSLRLREEAGAANSLPVLIQICRQRLRDDGNAEDLLEAALLASGYSVTHEAEYSGVHWRIVEETLFATEGRFPRITAASFPTGVPQGIEEIDYTINLSTFEDAVIARRPDEAHIFLRNITQQSI